MDKSKFRLHLSKINLKYRSFIEIRYSFKLNRFNWWKKQKPVEFSHDLLITNEHLYWRTFFEIISRSAEVIDNLLLQITEVENIEEICKRT